MVIRDAVRRLPAYRFSHHPQSVKLDQNEAPDDLSAELRAAVLSRLSDVAFNRYPELHPVTLENAVAARHDWDPAGVVVANGSNVLIQALIILSGLGREVVTVRPNFAVYAAQARILGAELSEHPLDARFALPMAELLADLEAGSGVLFLTDPAAPTGNAHPPEQIAELLQAARRRGTWLSVIDEAYSEFTGRDHLSLIRATENSVALRTFSKAAGLAGARLGYALTSPDVATELRKVLLPFSVSALQVATALAVLERPEVQQERVARLVAGRHYLAEAMSSLPGTAVFPSDTNFILFRVDDPAAVHAGLLERDVVVRRQDHLPGAAGCLRVNVGSEAENEHFLQALAESLKAALAARRTNENGTEVANV